MLRSGFHILLLAILVLSCGPACAWLVGSLRGLDGFTGTSPILSASPTWGILRAILAILLATFAGTIARAMVSRNWGMLAGGCTLAWAAAGTGTVPDLIRAAPATALPNLALESAVLFVPALFCAMVLGGRAAEEPWMTTRPRLSDRAALGVGVLLGISAGLLCTWVVAQNALKGQVIAAAALSGLAAAIGTCLLSDRIPSWTLIAGMFLLAIAAPILAAVMSPAGSELVLGAARGKLLPAARLLSLDWLAGGLIGVPIGLSWGRGLVQAPHQPTPESA